jgi:predicted Zn-dependent protease
LRKSICVLLLLFCQLSHAQLFSIFSKKEPPKVNMLLLDRGVQFAITDAVNNMYNYNFYAAEKEFKWLKVKYPEHPLGDFLLGLNEWWKIIPDTKQQQFDDACHAYMDEAIDKAEELYDDNKNNKEAAFFICAAYAVKGRLYTEREKWVKAAWAGKQSIKYLDNSRGEENINPELLFGDGVYNYYSKWIHENYKSLRSILTFFRKGDKSQGIKQLEYVSNNAFYTRYEARYFLVQIYMMEGQPTKSLLVSRTMHSMYPNNSFFHRHVASASFALGRLDEAEVYAKELIDRLKAGKYGYGSNDGRYGSYILAYINDNYRSDVAQAKFYYRECINYALQNNSKESGYYSASNLALGKIAQRENDYTSALQYYEEALEYAEKKSSKYQEAKAGIESIKKASKKKKVKF